MYSVNFWSHFLTALSYYLIAVLLAMLARNCNVLRVNANDAVAFDAVTDTHGLSRAYSLSIESNPQEEQEYEKLHRRESDAVALQQQRKLFNHMVGVAVLFDSFVVLCGCSHLVSAAVCLYGPSASMEQLLAVMLFLCAVVSVTTALLMTRLFPLMWKLVNQLELNDEGKLELLRSFMDTMTLFKESIAVLSLDFRIVQGNPSSVRFFGKEFSDVCLTTLIHDEDLANFKNAFALALHTNSSRSHVVEYRVKRPETEEYLWVESSLCKKRDISSSSTGSRTLSRSNSNSCKMDEISMITRNIDERKKAMMYEEMIKATKAEESKNAAKLSYISCVAHDLKTPLHSFCFSLDLLKDTELTEEQEELIETAEVSTDLMRLTISQTMDINKALSGKGLIPRRTTVSLSHVMKRVGIIINGYGKEVPISFHIDSDVCDSIITDEEWLWQMILNLLTNACKYTQEGSIEVVVSIRKESEGLKAYRASMTDQYHLLFEVRDSGVGIDPAKANSLFSAFGQAQEGASTGTGLGLFGLKSRVIGLGGKCGVHPNTKSETGSGSVFWFSIPYVKDSTVQARRKGFSEHFSVLPLSDMSLSKLSKVRDECSDGDKSSSRSRSKSIDLINCLQSSPRLLESLGRCGPLTAIVIDDVASIRKLMTKILLKIGFEKVFCYENGHKGLEAMKESEVDAVFSDVQMPVMTGPEMIKRFREFEQNQLRSGRRRFRQTVIAVTANGAESNNLVSVNGFDHVYPKPLDVDDLQNVMSSCVLRRKTTN